MATVTVVPARTSRAARGGDGRDTPYQQARVAGRQALREAVLGCAGRILATEGPASLTMRRMAEEIGASTTVIYGIFEDKNEIIDAIVTAGHKALRAQLDAIPESVEPLERLASTGRVYREVGLSDPARYQLMFGSTIPGYEPSAAARVAARESFDSLAGAVRACIDAGVIKRSADPQFVAEVLIAAAHGAVSLEITGHFEDPSRADERFALLLAGALSPFRRDQR